MRPALPGQTNARNVPVKTEGYFEFNSFPADKGADRANVITRCGVMAAKVCLGFDVRHLRNLLIASREAGYHLL